MTQFNYPYRHLVQITLETVAPLKIGSGEKGITTDALIVRDINDLPYIPGTSLAGIIAHALGGEKDRLMGNQKNGSRLIITEAKLVGRDGKVIDGVLDRSQLSEADRTFLDLYSKLPIRQHVRIGYKGTAADMGKFDEEVVVKGSRFCFEMELVSSEKENDAIDMLLSIILSPTFRIGSGSRSGFGEIKVEKCLSRTLDLTQEEDLKLYLQKSARIDDAWEGWEDYSPTAAPNLDSVEKSWCEYKLSLDPKDFILFGSGFGDSNGDSDITYVQESFIKWDNGLATIVSQDKTVLIPGSSVKGALAHRTAYHYNRLTGTFINEDGTLSDDKDRDKVTGNINPAVSSIFGSEGVRDELSGKLIDKKRGNILISDVLDTASRSKILNHVSIDRFTGGAIDGALFQEQTFYAKGKTFNIDFLVANDAFPVGDENIREAFEAALKDVATGMLPLGGGVNRGNGVFTGTVETFNKEKKQWEELK